MIEINKIYNYDCFDLFPQIDANQIDLVIVDLPYGQTSNDWDRKIDLDAMWQQLRRICKSTATYVFFCTTKFGNELIGSNPDWFRYDLVFQKANAVGFLQSNHMPLRTHEMLYVFYDQDYDDKAKSRNLQLRSYFKEVKQFINQPTTKLISECGHGVVRSLSKTFSSQFTLPSEVTYNKLIDKYHIDTMPSFKPYANLRRMYEPPVKNTYNPQMVPGKPYRDKVKQSQVSAPLSNYRSKIVQSSNETGERYPKSVIRFKPDCAKIHPTQKPVALNEYLIKTYSNPNDLVLDFCFGSGSSIVACINTNRRYIGCEKNTEIFNLASQRINNTLLNTK
jgi:site-specific DNA-methyltransferase (adenine-specific)